MQLCEIIVGYGLEAAMEEQPTTSKQVENDRVALAELKEGIVEEEREKVRKMSGVSSEEEQYLLDLKCLSEWSRQRINIGVIGQV